MTNYLGSLLVLFRMQQRLLRQRWQITRKMKLLIMTTRHWMRLTMVLWWASILLWNLPFLIYLVNPSSGFSICMSTYSALVCVRKTNFMLSIFYPFSSLLISEIRFIAHVVLAVRAKNSWTSCIAKIIYLHLMTYIFVIFGCSSILVSPFFLCHYLFILRLLIWTSVLILETSFYQYLQ